MFFPLKKILLILVSIAGFGGFGLWITYESTKKTIFDVLGNKRIISVDKKIENELIDVWTKTLNKLRGKTIAKTERFSKLRELINDEQASYTDLKDLCEYSKFDFYSSIFFTNIDLLNDVKNFCTITIEEVIGKRNIFKVTKDNDNIDKEFLNNKLKKLKRHSDRKDGKLPKFLKSLKDKLPKSIEVKDKYWEELADWCDKSYKFSFFDKSEDLWKQVSIYCKRN